MKVAFDNVERRGIEVLLSTAAKRLVTSAQGVVIGVIVQSEGVEGRKGDAGRLSDKESRIVEDAEKALLLLREDGTAVAFAEAVHQMLEDMQQVVLRLELVKVGKPTQLLEEDIIAALREMIAALKKAQQDMKDKQPPPGEPPPSQPQEPPLIDVLAELKMIRALQMRINRRTGQYSKLLDEEGVDKLEVIELLQKLAERESRVVRVTRDLEMERNK